MLPLARRLARTALPRLEEDDELGPSSSGAEAAVVRVAVASSTSGRLRTGSRRALEGGCLREPSGAARRGFVACSGFVNCCWWAWVRHGVELRGLCCERRWMGHVDVCLRTTSGL